MAMGFNPTFKNISVVQYIIYYWLIYISNLINRRSRYNKRVVIFSFSSPAIDVSSLYVIINPLKEKQIYLCIIYKRHRLNKHKWSLNCNNPIIHNLQLFVFGYWTTWNLREGEWDPIGRSIVYACYRGLYYLVFYKK